MLSIGLCSGHLGACITVLLSNRLNLLCYLLFHVHRMLQKKLHLSPNANGSVSNQGNPIPLVNDCFQHEYVLRNLPIRHGGESDEMTSRTVSYDVKMT